MNRFDEKSILKDMRNRCIYVWFLLVTLLGMSAHFLISSDKNLYHIGMAALVMIITAVLVDQLIAQPIWKVLLLAESERIVQQPSIAEFVNWIGQDKILFIHVGKPLRKRSARQLNKINGYRSACIELNNKRDDVVFFTVSLNSILHGALVSRLPNACISKDIRFVLIDPSSGIYCLIRDGGSMFGDYGQFLNKVDGARSAKLVKPLDVSCPKD